MKQQLAHSFSIVEVPKIVGRDHEERRGRRGRRRRPSRRSSATRCFAYGLPRATSSRRDRGPDAVRRADAPTVDEHRRPPSHDFSDARTSRRRREATAVALGPQGARRQTPTPAQTTVSVLNGNGVAGAARTRRTCSASAATRSSSRRTNATGNAPATTTSTRRSTTNPAEAVGGRGASGRRALRAGRRRAACRPRSLPLEAGGDAHRRRRHDVPRHARAGAPVRDADDARAGARALEPATTASLVRSAAEEGRRSRSWCRRCSRALVARPTRAVRTTGSTSDTSAVRLVFRAAGGVLGHPGDELAGRAVLDDQSLHHVIKRPRLRLLLQRPEAAHDRAARAARRYWVVNTLLDSLSNETMIAIAKGLQPSTGEEVG